MRKIRENISEIKDEVIVKVYCSFCEKEIDCPENMLKLKKMFVMTALKRLEVKFQLENCVKFMLILTSRNLERVYHLFFQRIQLQWPFQRYGKVIKKIKNMSKKEMVEEMVL